MARGTIVSEARSRGKKLDLEIVNCAQSATCLVVLANHGIQLARREHRKKKRNARREFYAIEIGSQ
jgi:hypothetical protein